MKPEKLILEGVYSYKNRTEIDFETLCRADLFGIFGNVGSGKSAILEAVTYALYGRIERLSSRVYYNMMNLASDSMKIDFIFRHRQERYRFTFETRRHRNDFEKIETPQRGGYRQDGEDWIPLFDKDGSVSADEIIGLNYDNFRRTIIVPQGRFQEFLHLEKSKRTNMLMELFQLNRFDLSRNISLLGKANDQKIANLQGESAGLGEVSDEAAAEIERQVKEVEQNIPALNEEYEHLSEKIKGWEGLAALYAELKAAEAGLELKKSLEESYSQRRKKLREYEDCVGRFRSQTDLHRLHKEDLEQARSSLAAAGLRLESGKNSIRQTRQTLDELTPQYNAIDEERNKAGWYADLAGIERERFRLKQITAGLEQMASRTAELTEKREETAAELENTKKKLIALDYSDTETELMARLGGLYDGYAAAGKAVDIEAGRYENAAAAFEALNLKTAGYQSLADEEAALEAREKALRQARLDAGINRSVGLLAEQLKDGRPCPLCGSENHPAPAQPLPPEADERLETEAAEIEQQKEELKERSGAYAGLKAELAAAESRAEAAAEQLEIRRRDKEALAESFPDCRFAIDKPEEFRAEYEKYTRQRCELGSLRQRSEELAAELERLSTELNDLNEESGGLRVESASAETKIAGTEARIDSDFLAQNSSLPADELIRLGKQLEARLNETAERYKEAGERMKTAELNLEKSTAEYNMLRKRVDELGEKLESAGAELERLLKASTYESLSQVNAILSAGLDAEKERAAVDEFESSLIAIKTRYNDLKEKISGREYDKDQHEEMIEKAGRLKDEQAAAVNRLGELSSRLRDVRERLQRKKALAKELKKLQLRAENINTLKNLFRANKFADYAATIYLRELCEAANSRFRKLTRESLRLELDEGNNFIIRDYLNEGRTRSVRTLSGGQTFQAAFSLSLALADSIGRERSGFFFLDEGFGSLDRESLALVFESLKSLKHEERTVGIISHVEDLKQEIDTFISVKKDDEEGSIIENSWNS